MPEVDPALLSEARIAAAYSIFLGSYVVFALGKFPWMKIDRPGAAIIGAVVFVGVTTVLSNVVSNVPAVMLLRTLVSGFADPQVGWLLLAMASTLAGNLTITGSVANIIVVERAAAEGVDVGFRDYFRIGLPVTLATLAFGALWLWLSDA